MADDLTSGEQAFIDAIGTTLSAPRAVADMDRAEKARVFATVARDSGTTMSVVLSAVQKKWGDDLSDVWPVS